MYEKLSRLQSEKKKRKEKKRKERKKKENDAWDEGEKEKKKKERKWKKRRAENARDREDRPILFILLHQPSTLSTLFPFSSRKDKVGKEFYTTQFEHCPEKNPLTASKFRHGKTSGVLPRD